MQNLKNILVATDLCSKCDPATDYAIQLAAGTEATVHLVHGAYAQGNPDNLPPAADLSDEEYELRLSTWLNRGNGVGSGIIARVVRAGTPSQAVLDYAVQNDIDLIVVGAERAGLLGFAQGDRFGRTVMREAPCPVTIVGDHLQN